MVVFEYSKSYHCCNLFKIIFKIVMFLYKPPLKLCAICLFAKSLKNWLLKALISMISDLLFQSIFLRVIFILFRFPWTHPWSCYYSHIDLCHISIYLYISVIYPLIFFNLFAQCFLRLVGDVLFPFHILLKGFRYNLASFFMFIPMMFIFGWSPMFVILIILWASYYFCTSCCIIHIFAVLSFISLWYLMLSLFLWRVFIFVLWMPKF